jgi:elongation factor P
MIKAVELRKGRTVIYEGKAYVVHDAQHVAKGNKASYMQAKLKGLLDGLVIDVRFRVEERLETPFLEDKEYEYLYQDGDDFVVMDTTTYDQIHIAADVIGDAVKFLKPNEKVTAKLLDGAIIGVELPHVVELEITDTPPSIKGATVTNQPKDATLETGARIRVPAFIESGERVRVDTRSGEYVERAK